MHIKFPSQIKYCAKMGILAVTSVNAVKHHVVFLYLQTRWKIPIFLVIIIFQQISLIFIISKIRSFIQYVTCHVFKIFVFRVALAIALTGKCTCHFLCARCHLCIDNTFQTIGLDGIFNAQKVPFRWIELYEKVF